jgi:cell division protease FtsH
VTVVDAPAQTAAPGELIETPEPPRAPRPASPSWRKRLAELNRTRRRRGIVWPVNLASASARLFLVLSATLAVLVGVFAWGLEFLSPASPGTQISISQLAGLAGSGHVLTATLYDFDHRVTGTYTPVSGKGAAITYWAEYPASDAETPILIDRLASGGAQVSVQHQRDKVVVQFIAEYLLPLVILANLFALIFIATRGGGDSTMGSLVEFSRIGGGKPGEGSSRVTFADVAGADDALVELREVRDYLTDPLRFAMLGAQPPKGVLMFGPPGCGKTLMARAVAGEAEVPFFSISGAEFVESLVGVGAARVRDLFRRVRAVAPAIIFIDEVDAAGRKRGGTGGQEERDQTLNQLLIEMDGFEVASGIVVMAATNRPDILDPALLRPGRFDRQVTVEPPDIHGRQEVLELYANRRPLLGPIDFAELSRRTAGFTGADLANVVNEAALLAVRAEQPAIDMAGLEEAVQRVLSGPQRRGQVLTDSERERCAFHEAAHAVVAAASGRLEDLQRVTIVPRGRALGHTATGKSLQERTLLSRAELDGELDIIMAGVAAERLRFGDISTGTEVDIERATELAQLMAGRYGMSERLGTVRILRSEGSDFLNADMVPTEVTAGTVLSELHVEVRQLVDTATERAAASLAAHKADWDALAARLLVEETVNRDDLIALLGHRSAADTPVPVR